MTEQFVGRDNWIFTKTVTDVLLGKKEINGVYLAAWSGNFSVRILSAVGTSIMRSVPVPLYSKTHWTVAPDTMEAYIPTGLGESSDMQVYYDFFASGGLFHSRYILPYAPSGYP